MADRNVPNSAAQEMAWQEKYTTMELLLTLDAQQAEKERDGLVARLNFVNKALDNASSELHSIKNQTQNMAQKNKEQEIRIAQLEDKCAWGRELEQV